MKKTITSFFKRLFWLSVAIFIGWTIWVLATDQTTKKWSKLLDETRALIPIENKEKVEDTIVRVCGEQNVPWIICIRVAICESGLDPYFKEKMKNGKSYDRGIFSINSLHYKQISDEIAFNVEEATRVFAEQYKNGKAGDWLCYNQIYGN